MSAFANAAGGDILVGVKADSGLPIELIGLDPTEVDSEILRIRQVVGTSVEPHLLLHFRVVPLPTGRIVLIIRVPRNWTAPHGIEHNGHFQFFQRHAAGRSPMTLSELRHAFTLSGSIIEQTKRFREERLAAIMAAEGPWGYVNKPLAVFHILPFAGIAGTMNIDLSNRSAFRKLSPLDAEQDGCIRQGDLRFNFDGVVMRQGIDWHTQLFRNGSVEYATTLPFEQTMSPYFLDAWHYQIDLLKVFARFSALQLSFGVSPPIMLLFSILNAANFHLRTAEGHSQIRIGSLSKHQIDRDRIFLPEIVFDDFLPDPRAELRPVFDCLWNAAGQQRCSFYTNGEWNIDPSWLDPPNAY